MFGLPKSTELNTIIPQDKFLKNVKAPQYMRDVFTEQIDSVIWTNKISCETCDVIPGRDFIEIELLQINLLRNALDKRALNCIDSAIPYYVIYMQQYNNSYQVWLGDKTFVRNGRVRISNYYRTRWISPDEFPFPIHEKNIDDVYRCCIERVEKLGCKRNQPQYEATAEAFISYCQNMMMSYSYKPLLILALIQNGGCMSAKNIVHYFQRYYIERKENGLTVEKGNCIFSDINAGFSAMERNVITNPVNALLGSGLFDYDKENKLLYIKSEIYDSLTLAQVDRIEEVCQMRLADYFNKIQS